MIAIRTWAAAALLACAAGARAETPPEPLPTPKPLAGPAVPKDAKSVLPTSEPAGKPGCETAVFQPYTSGCAEKGLSGNCLGRFYAWLCYRPICSRDACDCGANNCRPPLFSYFQCSPFHRRYDAVCCETGCGGKICGDRACRPKGPVTISVTLPRFSIGRCDPSCSTPCADTSCASGSCAAAKDASFAGPVGHRTTGDGSYRGPAADASCGSCRTGWFGGLFARRSCGSGGCGVSGCASGRLGGTGQFGKHPCPMSPPTTKVDLANLPILSPDGFKCPKPDAAPGVIHELAEPGQMSIGKKLIEKARTELKRGELASAKQIAGEAFQGSYGVKAEAAGLLKSIEVLESTPAVRQAKATAPAKPAKK